MLTIAAVPPEASPPSGFVVDVERFTRWRIADPRAASEWLTWALEASGGLLGIVKVELVGEGIVRVTRHVVDEHGETVLDGNLDPAVSTYDWHHDTPPPCWPPL